MVSLRLFLEMLSKSLNFLGRKSLFSPKQVYNLPLDVMRGCNDLTVVSCSKLLPEIWTRISWQLGGRILMTTVMSISMG